MRNFPCDAIFFSTQTLALAFLCVSVCEKTLLHWDGGGAENEELKKNPKKTQCEQALVLTNANGRGRDKFRIP